MPDQKKMPWDETAQVMALAGGGAPPETQPLSNAREARGTEPDPVWVAGDHPRFGAPDREDFARCESRVRAALAEAEDALRELTEIGPLHGEGVVRFGAARQLLRGASFVLNETKEHVIVRLAMPVLRKLCGADAEEKDLPVPPRADASRELIKLVASETRDWVSADPIARPSKRARDVVRTIVNNLLLNPEKFGGISAFLPDTFADESASQSAAAQIDKFFDTVPPEGMDARQGEDLARKILRKLGCTNDRIKRIFGAVQKERQPSRKKEG